MTKKPTPRLDRLFRDIERLCTGKKGYGLKSKLAKAAGATPQLIHKWVVARDNEPGGEATLAMLNWVKRRKRSKNKNRGGATNATTAEARKDNTYDETKQARTKR